MDSKNVLQTEDSHDTMQPTNKQFGVGGILKGVILIAVVIFVVQYLFFPGVPETLPDDAYGGRVMRLAYLDQVKEDFTYAYEMDAIADLDISFTKADNDISFTSSMEKLEKDSALYKFSGLSMGGSYKNMDNVITEEDASGNKTIRFQPMSAWETPEAMDQACRAYEEAVGSGRVDPLLIIPMFVLDFLCIHPFNDGNGRMSRLLTLLLLYRSGYIVGKYTSIEKLIEQSKETYYEVLQESSADWNEGTNSYEPFVQYLLGVIVAAYRDFEARVDILVTKGLSKTERIAEMIKGTLWKITKRDLLEQCPDISDVTVQRALNELVKSGKILKLSGGRYTSYIWNREND